MTCFRSRLSFVLRGILTLHLFVGSTPLKANDSQVHQMALGAAQLALTAGVVASVDSGISLASCFTPGGGGGHTACAMLGINIAAAAAGFLAMGQNNESAAETVPEGAAGLDGIGASLGSGAGEFGGEAFTPGTGAGLTLDSIGYDPSQLNDACQKASSICSLDCSSGDCQARFENPYAKDEVLDKIKEQIELRNIDLAGKNPEDYLNEVGHNLDQFETALAELNNLASGGSFDGGGFNSPQTAKIASSNPGQFDPAHYSEESYLSPKAKALRGKVKSLVDKLGLDLNLSEALRKRARRGRKKKNEYSILGGEIIDQSGRKLNLFERATKALRGQHERDLVMGHYESVRKRRLKILAQKNRSPEKNTARAPNEGSATNAVRIDMGMN